MKANLLPTRLVSEAEREQKMLTFWQRREAAVPSASERSLRWVFGAQYVCDDACVFVCVRARVCVRACVCVPQCLPKAMLFNVCVFLINSV